MIPFNSPLEKAQAYEIGMLKAELADYRKRAELTSPRPVWVEPETIAVGEIRQTITLPLVGEAMAAIEPQGVHFKARAKCGLHVGYYLSRERLAASRDIQAFILQELMSDISSQMAYLLRVGDLPDPST